LPASLLQPGKKNICDHIRVALYRRRLLAQQPLVEKGEVRFDEHRRDLVGVGVSKYATADPLADHPGNLLDQAPISIALVAAPLGHLTLIDKDAEKVAPLFEIREVLMAVGAELLGRRFVAAEDHLQSDHQRSERRLFDLVEQLFLVLVVEIDRSL